MTPAQLYDGILKAMNDKEAIELIEKAKKEWCRQQRKNCVDVLKKCEYSTNDPIKKMILNAPEP